MQPYTIVGHTAIPTPHIRVTLKASGVRALLSQCTSDDDLIHISMFKSVEWSEDAEGNLTSKDKYFNKFEVVHKKEQE